jgi:hypothetical protein
MPDTNVTGGQPAERGPAHPGRTDRSPWNWLLLLPLLAVLYPPLYNRTDPSLFGMPFFYWYQLAVIPLSVVCTVLVYVAGRRTGAR